MLRPLHSKGIVTMSLLVLAETISVTNAAASWNDIQQKLQARYSTDKEQTGGSCPATDASASFQHHHQQQVPTIRRFFATTPRSATHSKKNMKDCCSVECLHCLKEPEMARICHKRVPRGGHTATLSGMDAVTAPHGIPLHMWKVIFQAILTAINVACWLIPLKSKRISENKLGLSLANAFSGGVFLSLAFGHHPGVLY